MTDAHRPDRKYRVFPSAFAAFAMAGLSACSADGAARSDSTATFQADGGTDSPSRDASGASNLTDAGRMLDLTGYHACQWISCDGDYSSAPWCPEFPPTQGSACSPTPHAPDIWDFASDCWYCPPDLVEYRDYEDADGVLFFECDGIHPSFRSTQPNAEACDPWPIDAGARDAGSVGAAGPAPGTACELGTRPVFRCHIDTKTEVGGRPGTLRCPGSQFCRDLQWTACESQNSGCSFVPDA